MIDLEDMNRAYMTLDTIWMAIRLGDLLGQAVFDEAVFQYADVLKMQFTEIIHLLLRVSDVNFFNHATIEGLVA
jgi:hypothetical protein